MQFQAASMTLISFHGGCHMGFGISGRSRRGRTCWLDVQDMTWKYIATKEAKLCFDAVQFSHLNLSWRISRTGYLWHQRHHLAHRNTDRRSAIERERERKKRLHGWNTMGRAGWKLIPLQSFHMSGHNESNQTFEVSQEKSTLSF